LADGIEAERRGIPAAVVAIERLAQTIGRAMAIAHGVPHYPIAMIGLENTLVSTLENLTTESQMKQVLVNVPEQIEAILLTGDREV
jgi:hypothetical protein